MTELYRPTLVLSFRSAFFISQRKHSIDILTDKLYIYFQRHAVYEWMLLYSVSQKTGPLQFI